MAGIIDLVFYIQLYYNLHKTGLYPLFLEQFTKHYHDYLYHCIYNLNIITIKTYLSNTFELYRTEQRDFVSIILIIDNNSLCMIYYNLKILG